MMRRLLGVSLVAACQATSASLAALAADTDEMGVAEAAPRRQSSLLHVHRGSSEKKPDMSRMVSMMEKLAKGLEQEQDESKGLKISRAKECRLGIALPEKAIKKGKELVQETKENLETYKGDMKSLEATIAGIQKQITSALGEVDGLNGRLKMLRKKQKKAASSASASLQQLDRVIQKEYRLEKEVEEHPNTTPKPSGINAEVSKLEELNSQLDHSSTSEDVSEAPTDDDEAPAFVQTEMDSEIEEGIAAVAANVGAAHQLAVLKADKSALVKAREKAKKGFNDEENKLIDLLRIKKEEVEKLEASLREQQPILADKLKQASETDRSKAMAERVLVRDQEALQMMQDKCNLMAVASEQENKLRFQLINLIKMPAKLLEGMNSMLFLTKDLQDLGGKQVLEVPEEATSFLQTEAQSSSSSTQLADEMRAALRSSDDQEAKDAGAVSDEAPVEQQQQSASSQAMQMAMQMQQQVTMVQEENGDTATGPFDKVSGMIKSLMTSLRDQANEEMDLHQWCTEAEVKNTKDRIQIRAAMDETATEIHWAKSAIAALDDQLAFFSSELKRLTEHKAGVEKQKTDEKSRMDRYLADHRKPIQALEKVVMVLRQQCSINAKDLMLMQTNSSHVTAKADKSQVDPASLLQDAVSGQGQSRRGQCLEAAKMIVQGLAKFDELDKAIKKYRNDFDKVASSEVSKTTDAINMRSKGLRSAKSDRAERTSDMATSENDKKQSEKDLKLVETAKQQQEQKCQKKDTREDRMARRAEEIGALKSALKVMEGEEIPVSSLAQTDSHTVHT